MRGMTGGTARMVSRSAQPASQSSASAVSTRARGRLASWSLIVGRNGLEAGAAAAASGFGSKFLGNREMLGGARCRIYAGCARDAGQHLQIVLADAARRSMRSVPGWTPKNSASRRPGRHPCRFPQRWPAHRRLRLSAAAGANARVSERIPGRLQISCLLRVPDLLAKPLNKGSYFNLAPRKIAVFGQIPL